MDDIQIILYIVILVIGLLSRAFKSKKKQAPKPRQSSQSSEEQQQKPAMSFEELLREFEGKPAKKEAPQEEPQYESYEYEEFDDDEIKSKYESSLEEAQSYETIDELVDLEDDRHTGNFKHFRGYEEEEEPRANEFKAMLQNTEGARKSIILSEILKRKY